MYLSQTKFMKQMVDCIRIRETAPRTMISNQKALTSLKICKTLEELQKTFLLLTHEEKADQEVISLKNNLKITL
jgi:hypothetical protein